MFRGILIIFAFLILLGCESDNPSNPDSGVKYDGSCLVTCDCDSIGYGQIKWLIDSLSTIQCIDTASFAPMVNRCECYGEIL